MRISDKVRVSVVFAFLIAVAPLVAMAASSEAVPMLSFGDPVTSGRTVSIPVYLDPAGATDVSAWAICVRAPKDVVGALTIRRAANSQLQPQFETTARNADSVTYIAWSSESIPSAVIHVVDIEVPADHARSLRLELDKQLTTLSDRGGQHSRTAVSGQLKLDSGIDLDRPGERRRAVK